MKFDILPLPPGYPTPGYPTHPVTLPQGKDVGPQKPYQNLWTDKRLWKHNLRLRSVTGTLFGTTIRKCILIRRAWIKVWNIILEPVVKLQICECDQKRSDFFRFNPKWNNLIDYKRD